MRIDRQNVNFMNYFPDIYYKKDPPREFFWKIFAQLFPDDYRAHYQDNFQRIQKRISKPQTLKIDPEQRRIMLLNRAENIQLSLALAKPGITRNVTYLRRTRGNVAHEGPIHRYFTPARQVDERIYESESEA